MQDLRATGRGLLVATRDKAPARLRAFVRDEYAKVVGAVALATRDRDGAEDAVQDAIVKALASDSEPDNLAAWVTVVAINNARAKHRRADAERRAISRLEWPEQQGEPSVESTAIAAAVAKLPDRQRQIATLFYYLDTPVAGIAAAMDITEGTVKTQLHRARATLAESLKEVA